MNETIWNRAALSMALAAAISVAAGSAAGEPKKVPVKPAKPAAHAAPAKPMAAVKNVAHPAIPLPRKRPLPGAAGIQSYAQANVATRGALFATRATFKRIVRPVSGPFAVAPNTSTSPDDIEAVKRAIEAARKGKSADADAAARSIADPVARKLAEWAILRSDNTTPTFARYANFVIANPSWPHTPLFTRRAENALWNDRLDAATVLHFFSARNPTTAKGRYMLAQALLMRGDRGGAAALIRHAWRHEDCSADVERQVLAMFGTIITRDDERVRMEQRFYADDVEAGMRAATRLGGADLAIGRARAAVIRQQANAKALLDDVPSGARSDPGYIFARAQWLRKNNKPDEAGRLMLTVSQDPAALVDTDQWWSERRILVRKLLDGHDAHTAYRIARDAAPPVKPNWRVDQLFTAGWIALRYLHDPKTAAGHFSHIVEGTDSPHALSRGGYWLGRAADAMGNHPQAKAYYEQAAKHTATYYGQLARARLGFPDLGLVGPPALTPEENRVLGNLEVVRAAEILYALNERDLLASIYAELGESGTDIAGMAALGELAGKHGDGRSMVLLGQAAHNRGLPLDYYAFPTAGLPDYKPVAPPIEPAVAYSIARQESHFNQKIVSSAHAMGLMQVTPAAGIDTAAKYKVTYNRERLLKDPVYNMQMGAAELSNLLSGYHGSYLLTFAGYNAGRGRVKQWIEAYGDPRDPSVDPVDWVERIPIAETRNYVMRVMENLQVYRARFGGGTRLLIDADLKRGAVN